jgi:hypothetical protein
MRAAASISSALPAAPRSIVRSMNGCCARPCSSRFSFHRRPATPAPRLAVPSTAWPSWPASAAIFAGATTIWDLCRRLPTSNGRWKGPADLYIERIDDLASLCSRMADLLCDGQVLALYQGRSEFGPRALGHSSILADPRTERMRDWINGEVKQREWFRPLAPVVLAENAPRFFDLTHPAPFMQFAWACAPLATEQIPATVHVDRSARLQTVGVDDDPLLRALLTGSMRVPACRCCSTPRSIGKEEPIVETPQEALATFRATPMHALAMPPFLSRKRMRAGAAGMIRGYPRGRQRAAGTPLLLHVATDSRAFACTSTAGATARRRCARTDWLHGRDAAGRAQPSATGTGPPTASRFRRTGPPPSTSPVRGGRRAVVRHGARPEAAAVRGARHGGRQSCCTNCRWPPTTPTTMQRRRLLLHQSAALSHPPGARVSLRRPGGGIGGAVWGAPTTTTPARRASFRAHWDARFIRWLASQRLCARFLHRPRHPRRCRVMQAPSAC